MGEWVGGACMGGFVGVSAGFVGDAAERFPQKRMWLCHFGPGSFLAMQRCREAGGAVPATRNVCVSVVYCWRLVAVVIVSSAACIFPFG